MTISIERWLPISALLTLISAIFAFALLPLTGMHAMPGRDALIMWLSFIAAVASCFLLYETVKMASAGERHPIGKLVSTFGWPRLGHIYLGCWIFALNLYVFGILKPQLGQIVAFSADPLLARIDHLLLGTDAWRLLWWFHHPYMDVLYHEGWFAWIAAVFVCVLCRRPSLDQDRLVISYFALWSIFGPIIHLLLPAAGPVFFDDLGYGSRFAELHQSPQAQIVASYLWEGYVHKVFNAGGGISAMPSLHVATMVWTLIALRNSRWLPFAVVLNVYMFLASIAIGWHYAIDGIVGGAGALVCFAATSVKSWPSLQTGVVASP